MPSESETVAVVLYGNLGDWDRAEIVHKNAETRPTDAEYAEYAKLRVVARDEAMDVIDDHDIDDVAVVRPSPETDDAE